MCGICGHGFTNPSNTLEIMAYDVLTEEEMQWLEERKATILSFANNEFSGHVSMDDRNTYHNLAQRLVKFNFMVSSWTCGSCVQMVGKHLKNGMGWH